MVTKYQGYIHVCTESIINTSHYSLLLPPPSPSSSCMYVRTYDVPSNPQGVQDTNGLFQTICQYIYTNAPADTETNRIC